MKGLVVRYIFIAIVFVIAPLVLGSVLFDTAPKTGRTTFSTSAFGHKALYQLFRELDYSVRRFDKPSETPPAEGGVFIALEPGKIFLRKGGRYAQGLKDWIAQGNAALITLEPDADKSAETDDREEQDLAWLNRAQKTVRKLRDDSEKNKPTETSSEEIELNAAEQELVIIPFEDQVAAWLETPLLVTRLVNQRNDAPLKLQSQREDFNDVAIALTRARVFEGETADSLISLDGRTLLRRVRVGKGLVYLLSEPRLFHNQKIAYQGHAVLAVRLIEDLVKHAKQSNLYFEEFSHGRVQARNLSDLLSRGNMPWVFGHFVFLAILWVWFRAARVRTPRDPQINSSASQLQMIQALARLYELSADRDGLPQKLAESNRRWLIHKLQAEPNADLIGLICQRTGQERIEVQTLLDPLMLKENDSLPELAQHLADLRKRLH